jgi:hypothetical protein
LGSHLTPYFDIRVHLRDCYCLLAKYNFVMVLNYLNGDDLIVLLEPCSLDVFILFCQKEYINTKMISITHSLYNNIITEDYHNLHTPFALSGNNSSRPRGRGRILHVDSQTRRSYTEQNILGPRRCRSSKNFLPWISFCMGLDGHDVPRALG